MTWLPIPRTALPAAALTYAAQGWRVFPVAGKLPLVARGFYDATTDAATIRGWDWSRATGIGWAMSAGLIVLDVDGRHGGIASLAELERAHGRLPETLEAVTGGGGLHVVVRIPTGVEAKQSAGAVAAGLDVRVGGKGYIVVAPSRHASGLRYRWQGRKPIALAPTWLVELVRVRPAVSYTPCNSDDSEISDRYAARALAGEAAAVASSPEGERNHRLYAAWLRCTRDLATALDREHVRAELTRAAQAAGLGLPEIARTLR
jgi:hypothetical protein